MIQICRFLTTGKNLRTMFAIFPFFIVLQFYPSVLSSVNIFFTIGRFMTLFKLTDFISSRRSSRIVNNTLLRAYPTLLYMIWTVLIVAILMSSIIFLTERGEFTVNEDYPDGAFLRPDVLQSSKEESPFKSVLVSMYYVLVTMTSTGYGDLYCTSSLGRFLSNILMCSAVFILALPIAVLGNILSEEVDNYNKRKQDRNIVVEKQLRKGRKLPTYKYRRGPSLVGAKEMVGKTIRRFSAITASPSPIQRQEKPITPKNETFALAPSALEEENVPLNRKKRVSTGSSIRRGSESGYDRRLRSSTVEKINRLSVSNIEYVESSVTLQPFGSPPGSMSDDCVEEKGIVLNPIRSSSQRSTSVSKLFQSSDQNLLKISKSQSMKSNQSDPSLLVDVQQRILDIENQIEKYSNLYHERMKDCLDIYQQIQIQMKIRNELLKSLSID